MTGSRYIKWQRWIDRDPDPESRAELQALIDSKASDELTRRFASRLEFGTAGLRGVVGAGPGMMNRLVIRETSAGLGAYLLNTIDDAVARGIVVGFDARLDSAQFARDAACVFAALGIAVFLGADVMATPVAAFGVNRLGAAAGIVVTASHNPPQYNGYKVYWDNGAQIIAPHDGGIAAAIEAAAEEDIPWIEFDEAIATGKIRMLDQDFYRAYVDTILASDLYATDRGDKLISIAYTPLHGVGAEMAETLLGETGFDNVHSVASQREPDGHFPTLRFPNPEEPGAMDAVIALARAHRTTLACANDPDADRLAVAIRTESGDYQMLTGDMLGVLLGNYLLQQQHDFVPIVCTTIVSSSMLRRIAAAAGAQYYETLTGFKWLSNVALEHEDAQHRFLFAYEEALGYACGRQVLDKDGLSALLAFAQMSEALARNGLTIMDQLESLYRRHGLFLTTQRSIALTSGTRSFSDQLRDQTPVKFGGSEVAMTDDLFSGLRHYANGQTETLDFPQSDVLIYRLENNSRVIVRPSGTEPKLKCYYEVVETIQQREEFSAANRRGESSLSDLVDAHQESLAGVLSAAL